MGLQSTKTETLFLCQYACTVSVIEMSMYPSSAIAAKTPAHSLIDALHFTQTIYARILYPSKIAETIDRKLFSEYSTL